MRLFARSMVRNAARALDSGHPDTVALCSMAKVAGQSVQVIVNPCLIVSGIYTI